MKVSRINVLIGWIGLKFIKYLPNFGIVLFWYRINGARHIKRILLRNGRWFLYRHNVTLHKDINNKCHDEFDQFFLWRFGNKKHQKSQYLLKFLCLNMIVLQWVDVNDDGIHKSFF